MECENPRCRNESEGVNVFDLYPSRSVQTLHGFYTPLAFLPTPHQLCKACASTMTLKDHLGEEGVNRLLLQVQDSTTLFPDLTMTRRAWVEYGTKRYMELQRFLTDAKRLSSERTK